MRVFFPPRAKKREATDFECHFFPNQREIGVALRGALSL